MIYTFFDGDGKTLHETIESSYISPITILDNMYDEGIKPQKIHVSDIDGDIIERWRVNGEGVWDCDIIGEIEKHYPNIEFPSIDEFDNCVLGVVVVDNSEMLLYDTDLIISKLAIDGIDKGCALENIISQMQAVHRDVAFTDFPTKWKTELEK